jgi:hypothetical protein
MCVGGFVATKNQRNIATKNRVDALILPVVEPVPNKLETEGIVNGLESVVVSVGAGNFDGFLQVFQQSKIFVLFREVGNFGVGRCVNADSRFAKFNWLTPPNYFSSLDRLPCDLKRPIEILHIISALMLGITIGLDKENIVFLNSICDLTAGTLDASQLLSQHVGLPLRSQQEENIYQQQSGGTSSDDDLNPFFPCRGIVTALIGAVMLGWGRWNSRDDRRIHLLALIDGCPLWMHGPGCILTEVGGRFTQ